jgi:hypothetical protein
MTVTVGQLKRIRAVLENAYHDGFLKGTDPGKSMDKGVSSATRLLEITMILGEQNERNS